MAEDKKSFILYTDITYTVELLSNEQKGVLFQYILDYVNDKSPETNDMTIKLAFEPIKQQFKRDLKKWESIREKRSKAGTASAKKRKQNQHMSTHVESVEQTSTNPTVNVNVNVNDNVNDINNNIKREILENQTWMEAQCIAHKLTQDDFYQKFEAFWAENYEGHILEDSNRIINEIKRHFKNTVKKTLNNQTSQSYADKLRSKI